MKVLLLTAATILGVSAIFLPLVTSAPAAQTPASAAGTPLGPDDTYFVTQTSLGTPFQVDSGRDPGHSELCGVDGEFPHHRE